MHPPVAPSAPVNVAKRLSKLRFSWITTTTCWMYFELLPLPDPVSRRVVVPSAEKRETPPPTQPASSTTATQALNALRAKIETCIQQRFEHSVPQPPKPTAGRTHHCENTYCRRERDDWKGRRRGAVGAARNRDCRPFER